MRPKQPTDGPTHGLRYKRPMGAASKSRQINTPSGMLTFSQMSYAGLSWMSLITGLFESAGR